MSDEKLWEERLLAKLKDLEWSGGWDVGMCPECARFKNEGHPATCELGRLLKVYGQEGKP